MINIWRLHLQKVEKTNLVSSAVVDALVLMQAVIMYEGLKEKKITTALVMFKGEQHGFRTSNAIRRALDGEFFFYGKVLGMPGAKMPDDLEPIPIANL